MTGIKIEAGQDSTKNSKYSIDDILNQAEQSIEEYNYEMAQKFLERALEINSDHPRALEMTASLLLEVCNSFDFKKKWAADCAKMQNQNQWESQMDKNQGRSDFGSS